MEGGADNGFFGVINRMVQGRAGKSWIARLLDVIGDGDTWEDCDWWG